MTTLPARERELLDDGELVRVLDAKGLGTGPVSVRRLSGGMSNITYRLERDGVDLVLRRPPLPPYTPGAHDVMREATVLAALAGTRVPVPRVVHREADPGVLGAPFYLMESVPGQILTERTPSVYWDDPRPGHVVEELLDGLAAIHDVDPGRSGLAGGPRAESFLHRQLRRWDRSWEQIRIRPLDAVAELSRRLHATVPASRAETVVHGDYRFANLMFSIEPEPVRLLAVLDWEVAAVGDPLVDLGYLLGTYPVPGDADGILLEDSRFTLRDGFPDRSQIVAGYRRRTGREVDDLPWYMSFVLWRTAIGLEALHARHRRGNGGNDEVANVGEKVPALLERALRAGRGDLL